MSTWKILGMERLTSLGSNENVITTVSWECEQVIEHEGVFYRGARAGTVALDTPSGSFVSFSDITQDTALNWCKNILGQDAVSALETEVDLAAEVCSGRNKSTISGMPWE